jgi:catechol 2,3-dioxygenase-like lactoylglutathione lyase family enzyme
MAKLYRVILPVTDIEAAVRFYGTILGGAGTRVSPGRHYFDCEGTILACYDAIADGDAHAASPNPDHIYLAVDDLEGVYQSCRAIKAALLPGKLDGGAPAGEIAQRPWGERSFYLKDPFGNPICFVDRATVFTG